MHSVNPMDLSGRVALVTGGAGGLGKGSALTLAQFGADIAIADRNTEAGNALVAELQNMGRKAFFMETDMMDIAQVRAMVSSVTERFGRLDILINNVGGGRPVAFLEQSANSIDRHISLNLLSALHTTQAAVPAMIEGQRGGVIINVASTEALRAAPGYAVYAACKAALVSFTRTMALELAEHNIRSHALAPDMLETEGLTPLLNAASEAEKAARDRYIPLGHMGTPEDFGNLVAFLVSDMATYLNGLTVPVDAGATAASGWYRAPDGRWCLYHGS